MPLKSDFIINRFEEADQCYGPHDVQPSHHWIFCVGMCKKIFIHTWKIWDLHHLQDRIKMSAAAVTCKILQKHGKKLSTIQMFAGPWMAHTSRSFIMCMKTLWDDEHIPTNPISKTLFSQKLLHLKTMSTIFYDCVFHASCNSFFYTCHCFKCCLEKWWVLVSLYLPGFLNTRV